MNQSILFLTYLRFVFNCWCARNVKSMIVERERHESNGEWRGWDEWREPYLIHIQYGPFRWLARWCRRWSRSFATAPPLVVVTSRQMFLKVPNSGWRIGAPFHIALDMLSRIAASNTLCATRRCNNLTNFSLNLLEGSRNWDGKLIELCLCRKSLRLCCNKLISVE